MTGSPILAQNFPSMQTRPLIGYTGTPSMIDMPTANVMREGDLSFTAGYFGPTLRNTLTYQFTSRLAGSFRYSIIDGYDLATTGSDRFDRSFDLTFLLAHETETFPAVSVGVLDFGGTGIYSSEYVAATKNVGPFSLTGGIGWGRLGTYNNFKNPLGYINSSFNDRPAAAGNGLADTGRVDFGDWFRGPAALFGGLRYQASERLILTFEYSSDSYVDEMQQVDFEHESPFNFSATYRFDNGIDLTGSYVYGSYAGLLLNYRLNPGNPPGPASGREGQGSVVIPRSAAALGWADLGDDQINGSGTVGAAGNLQDNVASALEAQGVELLAMRQSGSEIRLWTRNERWQAEAQAIGRGSRALTGVLPPEIETIIFIPTTLEGLSMSEVTLQRSDLESLEHDLDGSWKMFARTSLTDAGDMPAPELVGNGFYYGLGLYWGPTFSNPDNIVAEGGLRFDADYMIRPGLVLSAELRLPLIDTGSGGTPAGTSSKVTPVRSDAGFYDDNPDLGFEQLTLNYYMRPAENFYGRVSLGYFERMYAGLSGEVLWKPVSGPLALGFELNFAQKRDYDTLMGLADYNTVTGYASAYYDFGNGFLGQIDAGRYLAQDWGGTISLGREFGNGFRLGVYMTLTNVPFDDFGEGSFDKGISFSIPLTWLLGEPARQSAGTTWKPVNNDGGARMQISDRLYDKVRRGHQSDLQDGWGRFWR